MKHTTRKASWLVAGIAALSLGVVPMAFAEPGTLSDAEATEIAFMREEERLARDLYQAFSDQYDGARPFSRIVNAEQQHHDTMGTLLTRYGLDDPSADLPAGTYANADLQELYTTWLAEGSVSIEAAYQVGVDLETRDIADLDGAIAAATADDVKAAFERLQNGSESHLAAFQRAVDGQLGTGVGAGQGPRGNAQAGQGGGQGQYGDGTCDGTCDGTGPQDGTGAQNGPGAGQGMQGQGAGSGVRAQDGTGARRGGGQGAGQGGRMTGPQDGSGPGAANGTCPNI